MNEWIDECLWKFSMKNMIYFVDDIPNDMAKYCNKTEISSQEGQYFFLQKQGKRGLQMER